MGRYTRVGYFLYLVSFFFFLSLPAGWEEVHWVEPCGSGAACSSWLSGLYIGTPHANTKLSKVPRCHMILVPGTGRYNMFWGSSRWHVYLQGIVTYELGSTCALLSTLPIILAQDLGLVGLDKARRSLQGKVHTRGANRGKNVAIEVLNEASHMRTEIKLPNRYSRASGRFSP